MSVRKRITRAFITLGAVLSVVIVLAPAGASAHVSAHGFFRPTTFGVTSLTLNPSTAATLTSAPPAGLGLTVGPVAPAYASANGDLNFPIVSSPLDALRTGDIDHTGGIAISGGGKTVDLTNFVISVNGQSLTADVSVLSQGSTTSLGAVNIVGLSFSGSRLHLGFGGLSLGPVAATLNSTALGALGSVFGVPALGTTITSLPLGTVTVHYRLFF